MLNKNKVKIIIALVLIICIGSFICLLINKPGKKVQVMSSSVINVDKPIYENENHQKKPNAKPIIMPANKEKRAFAKPPIKINNNIENQRTVPILMYHYIDTGINNDLMTPKDKFRQQMLYLKNAGFHTITLDQLYGFMTKGDKLPEKPIVITFDDGYEDNYTNAYPVLKEMGFKATIFVVSGGTGKGPFPYMNDSELSELDKNGIDIEPHTVDHKKLDTLSYQDQKNEIELSKSILQAKLGKKMKYFAYPYGQYNEDTLKILKENGFKMAFSTVHGRAGRTNNIYRIKRIYIGNSFSMERYEKTVEGI